MRMCCVTVSIVASVFSATCAKRVPEPAGVGSGVPHVSWVIMHGDRDNPDREFACQSEPRGDCVIPASRSDAQVLSDVHVYYHGAGAETKYAGTMQIGFFRGAGESTKNQTNITVRKMESITNQSVTGIVTDAPGEYAVTFELVATVTDTGKSQPIRERVPIAVK
jgi:hypothetical protein